MTEDEKLIEFAGYVLSVLYVNEEWSSETTDLISEKSHSLGLSCDDADSMFDLPTEIKKRLGLWKDITEPQYIYTIHSRGYYKGPEYTDEQEARDDLKAMVEDDVKMCRKRFASATGTKHKIGDDHYRITIGPDKDSALYSEHYIRKTERR